MTGQDLNQHVVEHIFKVWQKKNEELSLPELNITEMLLIALPKFFYAHGKFSEIRLFQVLLWIELFSRRMESNLANKVLIRGMLFLRILVLLATPYKLFKKLKKSLADESKNI
jgi:hypothetical protein